MRPRDGLRVTTLVIVALVAVILGWVGMTWWVSSGHGVPEPGWVGLVVMGFLGGGILVAGYQVKQVREGRSVTPMSPIRAARTLVLGQAAALTGAVLTGWYASNALIILPNIDVASQQARLWPLLAHLVVAILLAVAGMVTQSMCRIKPPKHEDEDDTDRSGGGHR
ncbi:MAG: DUF3180 domain-containing protein [Intrasporangium sp.]|uniref:DUF3180 domain-containing protein n=1 Tax=Intrasporangium sp. TaxID=1925024 RepID=UPI00264934F8|nr:DUF3180 domain-containing protein [Intrasporangium sp.]MDN5795428.1 DUF3180 domain-containing protein [Intrasporangium sp.]